MAQTVGNHSVATFTAPANGDALDATVVQGNDNTLRASYVDHDADPGIHLQSSSAAAQPVAGTVGRKWLTTDSGAVRLYYDDGSNWNELTLDAASLTSGTLPNARFPATLPAASGANLTALNASNLASGTIPDARFPAVLPAVSGANLTNLPTAAAAAGTLTGTTLASNVVNSSLTGVGVVNSGTWSSNLKGYGEVKTAPTISSGTLTLNMANGNVFDVALNANITTLTITNPPASGTAGSFTLNLTADGTARTVTWGASVKWPGGTAPTLTSTNGKVDVFVLYTLTGGTTWFAFTAGQNL
jgi:hypothetical protein